MLKRQLNFGLVDAETVQKIKTCVERFSVDLMENGYSKLNKKQFTADALEIWGPTLTKWASTALSISESKVAAKKEVLRQRMLEDVNKKLRALMIEIHKIVVDSVDKVLENYYAP